MSSIDTRTDRLRPGGPAVVRAGPLPYALSGALAAAATVSAAFSFFLPSALTGAAVGNGNLQGTALVVLLLGVPTLLMAVVGTSRGSTRWLVVWLGTLGYLLPDRHAGRQAGAERVLVDRREQRHDAPHAEPEIGDVAQKRLFSGVAKQNRTACCCARIRLR